MAQHDEPQYFPKEEAYSERDFDKMAVEARLRELEKMGYDEPKIGPVLREEMFKALVEASAAKEKGVSGGYLVTRSEITGKAFVKLNDDVADRTKFNDYIDKPKNKDLLRKIFDYGKSALIEMLREQPDEFYRMLEKAHQGGDFAGSGVAKTLKEKGVKTFEEAYKAGIYDEYFGNDFLVGIAKLGLSQYEYESSARIAAYKRLAKQAEIAAGKLVGTKPEEAKAPEAPAPSKEPEVPVLTEVEKALTRFFYGAMEFFDEKVGENSFSLWKNLKENVVTISLDDGRGKRIFDCTVKVEETPSGIYFIFDDGTSRLTYGEDKLGKLYDDMLRKIQKKLEEVPKLPKLPPLRLEPYQPEPAPVEEPKVPKEAPAEAPVEAPAEAPAEASVSPKVAESDAELEAAFKEVIEVGMQKWFRFGFHDFPMLKDVVLKYPESEENFQEGLVINLSFRDGSEYKYLLKVVRKDDGVYYVLSGEGKEFSFKYGHQGELFSTLEEIIMEKSVPKVSVDEQPMKRSVRRIGVSTFEEQKRPRQGELEKKLTEVPGTEPVPEPQPTLQPQPAPAPTRRPAPSRESVPTPEPGQVSVRRFVSDRPPESGDPMERADAKMREEMGEKFGQPKKIVPVRETFPQPERVQDEKPNTEKAPKLSPLEAKLAEIHGELTTKLYKRFQGQYRPIERTLMIGQPEKGRISIQENIVGGGSFSFEIRVQGSGAKTVLSLYEKGKLVKKYQGETIDQVYEDLWEKLTSK